MKLIKIILSTWFVVRMFCLSAQSVGIGTTTPDSSAILDLSSTTKGFLMPRMTTAQRDAIVNPEEGLQVYNLDDGCVDIYYELQWNKNCEKKIESDFMLSPNHWIRKADFGGMARYGSVGFSIGNKGYIGTGNEGTILKKDFWEYDQNTNIWTQKADFGGSAREYAVGFSIGNKGYLGTGKGATGMYSNGYKDDFWEYDQNTNVWTQKADFEGGGRSEAVGFSIDTAGYIGTGKYADYFTGITNYLKDFWAYNPTLDTWTEKDTIPSIGRSLAFGFGTLTKGYLGTGRITWFGFNSAINDFYEFNPLTNSWSEKADFGGGKIFNAFAFYTGEDAYAGTTSNFWKYDIANNVWTKEDNVPSSGSFRTSFSIGSNGYTLGDNNEFFMYNTEPYAGTQYLSQLPDNVYKYSSHDWTSEANELYTTLSNVNAKIRGDLGVTNLGVTNILEFSPDNLYKEQNAGKIGYQTYSNNALDIVGAGTHYPDRRVKIFDRLYFDKTSDNRKLVLYETNNNDSEFFGLGINDYTLRYNVPSNVDRHAFYSGNNLALSISGRTVSGQNSGSITFPNSIDNKKLILYDNNINSDIDFYGFGINAAKVRYQVPAGNYHSFYAGNSIVAEAQYNGNFWVLGSYQGSDRRLKKDIKSLDFNFSQLAKINSYQYRWIDSAKDQRTQAGFIAQEIAEIFPNLVSENSEGTLGVNYIGLIPYLVEAVKQLKKENEELEMKNEKLRMKNDTEISNLNARLEKLELIMQTFNTKEKSLP